MKLFTAGKLRFTTKRRKARNLCAEFYRYHERNPRVAEWFNANPDGKQEQALQVIRNNPTLSQQKIVLKLKELGIKRSASWVGKKRFDMLNVGVKVSET